LIRSTRVEGHDLLPSSCPKSITKSGFKTIIIVTFIFTLIQVNDQLDLWLMLYLGLTLKLIFKTIIITSFILMFGSTWIDSLDSWPRLYLVSTVELSFKTMIIIIFFIACLSRTILELRVFYKDILKIKKYIVFEDLSSFYLLFWKYINSFENCSRNIIIFISLFLFLQSNIY
jgi:hypothetical protein